MMKRVSAIRLFALSVVTVFAVSLTLLLPADEGVEVKAQIGFTNASVEGTYAVYSPAEVRATVDGSVLSLAHFDGQGSWTSSNLRNTPDRVGGRLIESFDSFGTYDVNVRGMATAVSMTAEDDGTVTSADFDFVITHTVTQGRLEVATQFFAIPRLSSTGKPSSLVFKRLPDAVAFSNDHLEGKYAYTYSIGDNVSAGLGVMDFTASGSLSGQQLENTPSLQAGSHIGAKCFPCLTGDGIERERQIAEATVGGDFSLNSDGMGTQRLLFTSAAEGINESNFDILVTQAEVVGNSIVVTEFIALQREPEGGSGALRTLFFTRLTD